MSIKSIVVILGISLVGLFIANRVTPIRNLIYGSGN
jgi:hypothetical protein